MKDNPQHHAVTGAATGRGTALALAGAHSYAAEMAANISAAERFEQSGNLRDLLRIFLKRKWTILIIFAVFALFSVVRTYLLTPVYRASTTIQIEKFQPRVFDFKEVTPSDQADDNADFYQTNYELLKSRTLAERTVEDIGLRRAPPAASLQEPVKGIPGEAPAGSVLEGFFNRMVKGPVPVAIDPAIRDDNSLVGAFQGSITVEPVRRSRLVRLHFDSTDPFFAAKAVNALAQSFININIERRFEATSYAKTFLEEKLLQTKARLEDSERELVSFSRDLEIFNVDEKQQSISNQNLQEFSSAVSKAEQERIRTEAVSKQAQENPDAILSARQNSNVLDLKDRKAKLEAEYQDNLKVYKPAFPRMQQLQGQIGEVDKQLRAEYQDVRRTAQSTYRTALSQETMLRARLGGAKQELLDLQGRSIRYGILKREVDTNRTLYDALLGRLKEIGVAGGIGINNISIVDKAQVPLYPFKPDLARNVTTGLAIGLLIGLIVAWVLEHLDDSIRFADDVERETGTPVLGVVPKLKLVPGKDRLALGPHLDPTSAFAEAYRSVRSALQFSTANGAPRRLMVTSSSKNEGKSTTALALAINFAQMGKPVLLIDADLRQPVIHKLMRIDNARGLSNCLSSDIRPLTAIQRTEIPNLFVMTSGPLPPNPVELLSGMKLLSLLTQCEEHFAHVIVDGPPVLGIADSIVLSNQVDNAVFVIESGRTRKGHAKAALKRLHQAGVHPIGVILTKIDAYHDLHGYNSYYYQYAKPRLVKKQAA